MFPQIYTTQSRTRKRGIAGGLDVEKHTIREPLRGAEPPLGVRTNPLHSFPAQSLNLQIQELKN